MKKYRPLCSLFLLLLFSCQQKIKRYEINGETQGTTYHIVWYATRPTISQQEVDSLLNAFDQVASLYNKHSELVQLNARHVDTVSSMLADLLKKSLDYAELTNGYFDITVAPLVKKWGFIRKQNTLPDSAEIDSLLRCVGYKYIHLDGHRVKFDKPCVEIDLNAIAQGYSVDLLANYFEKKGVHDYIVEVGGEVRAAGRKPDGSLWTVGIEKPTNLPDAPKEVFKKVRLTNKSLATSGTTRKFYVKNGVKYSHAINPFTGYPVQHTLLMVTVIAPTCTEADALATAFLVMGKEKARALLSEKFPGVDAFFISVDSTGGFQIESTPGFAKILASE